MASGKRRPRRGGPGSAGAAGNAPEPVLRAGDRAQPAGSNLATMPVDASVVAAGVVSASGVTLADAGYSPEIALWVVPATGLMWGFALGPPGRSADTLAQALIGPGLPGLAGFPGTLGGRTLPGRLVVADAQLAKGLRRALGRSDVAIVVDPQILTPLEGMMAAVLGALPGGPGALLETQPLDLKSHTISSLCAAAVRLWDLQPWQFAYEDPLFEIAPPSGATLYASVLGANEEVFGVAFYTHQEDFLRDEEFGADLVDDDLDDVGDEADDEADDEEEATLTPEAMADVAAGAALVADVTGRVILFGFDDKDELPADYVRQMVRHKWPRRLDVVPTLTTRGGTPPGAPLTEDEAQAVVLAVEALVAFAERHEDAIAEEAFPIHDTVEVRRDGQAVAVRIAVPPTTEAQSPTASVYRFKVTLARNRRVWCRIEVRSDQALAHLHDAIQEAFGWDDDHLYAFFLSGRAWDSSSEFVRPEAAADSGAPSARVRLARLALPPKHRFLYIFDFGDEWRCHIDLEAIDLQPDGGAYPRIVESHGQAPAQYR